MKKAPRAALLLCFVGCGGAEPPPGFQTLVLPPPALIATKVRVDPVTIVPSVLFPEEEREVRVAIGAFLRASSEGRLAPIDNAELERVASYGREGRRLSTGEVCGAPAPAGELWNVAFADALVADTFAGCDEGGVCTLAVDVTSRPGEEHAILDRYRAPISASPSKEELLAAVGKLVRIPPPVEGALSGILGALGPNFVGLRIDEVSYRGPWQKAPPVSVYDAVRPALDACMSDVRRDYWKNDIALEVGTDGKMNRCEPWLWYRLPWPGTACVCEALRGVQFDAGPAGRRARFEFSSHLPPPRVSDGRVITAYLSDEKASDETAVSGPIGVSGVALAQCFVANPPAKELQFTLGWQVDAGGRTQSVRVDLPEASQRACVEGVVKAAQFACPQAGAAVSVTAIAHVTAYVPMSLSDVLQGK